MALSTKFHVFNYTSKFFDAGSVERDAGVRCSLRSALMRTSTRPRHGSHRI